MNGREAGRLLFGIAAYPNQIPLRIERPFLRVGNRDDGTMPRREIERYGRGITREILQVGTQRELVFARGIHVVHQNVGIRIDQLEDAGALDRGVRDLKILIEQYIPFGELVRKRRLDAVAAPLGLEEEMEGTVLADYIRVDGRLVAIGVEQLRNGFELRKGAVRISVIDFVAIIGPEPHCEVDHVFSGHTVENDLRRPDAVRSRIRRKSIRNIDRAGFPVDQIGRFQHDETTVRCPPLGGDHVGRHHVIAVVFAPQNMRIAHPSGGTDRCGTDDGIVFIESLEFMAIIAHGETDRLLTDVVSGKIGEKIPGEFFGGGSRPAEKYGDTDEKAQ